MKANMTKTASINPAASPDRPLEVAKQQQDPKEKAPTDKRVAALRTGLLALLDGSDADREFLEAMITAEPKFRELLLRVVELGPKSYLQYFLPIMEEYTGSTSPAEEFIIQLALDHAIHGGITPDEVEEDVAEFRRIFESYAGTVASFARHYPQLVAPKTTSPDQESKNA